MSSGSVYQSGPNIFEDIGIPDAKTHFLKAQIVAELYRIAQDRDLPDAAVAVQFGIGKIEVDALFRGDFQDYAIERLMGFLNAFDQDVEIVARPRATGSASGGTVTFRAA
jgi:predicted XRE-type DNA-binding protein